MARNADTSTGQINLGPSTGDTDWILALHASGRAPTADEQEKLGSLRSRSMSDVLNEVIDAVLAR